MTDQPEASHAILSPSSAKRWMACTPSARAEEKYPQQESPFAAEGTLAHSISELILKHRTGKITKAALGIYLKGLTGVEHYSEEMLTYCEQYADYCMSTVKPDSHVAIETKLDITTHVPEGFGTGDFMSVTPSLKLLEFTDLKYGKGVPVYAKDNPQLKIYAIGALAWWGWLYDIETVRVNIYQPRINNNSSFEIKVSELMEWADNVLKPLAIKAFAGEGEYVVGDHCKFCKARVRCQALADHNLDLFKHELRSHNDLTDDQLTDIFKRSSILFDWVKDIVEHMNSEAVKGKHFAGLKLVEGKSNRVFVSEGETEKKLLAEGLKDIYTPKKLLGITELKKNIGTAAFKTLVEPDLRKPPGKPTLVPEDDPRQPFDNAIAVFKEANLVTVKEGEE